MTVKVTQVQKPVVKVKDQLKSSVLTEQEREAVDRLLVIDKALAPLRAAIKEEEKLRKYLSEVASDAARFTLKEAAILKGAVAEVEYSPAGDAREISDKDGVIQALKEKMGGYENLIKVIKINLGDVDKYLSEPERAPYIKTVTGSRRFVKVQAK